MVLGSCACCAGMLPFWFICVVYVWRWLCGLVFVFRRLNTKHPAANVGARESVVLRGLPAAPVLAFCLLVCYVWPG